MNVEVVCSSKRTNKLENSIYLILRKKNDPLSQVIDGIYHYRRLLDTIAYDLSDRFPVEAAVWFSTCNISDKISFFPLKYREVSDAVLGDEDFSLGKQAIQSVFSFYSNREKVSISDDEYNRIIELIARDFELISAPGAKKGELDRAFIRLTNEQIGLLDYISEQKNATIQGVAGTGKTLIAKEAARRFGAEGRQVLFLCFNRLLFSYLQKTFPYKNVTYFNIHSFIARYRSGADTSTVEKRSSELQRIDWNLLSFEDVIIDEAQDFNEDMGLCISALLKAEHKTFYVFYDENQNIYSRSFGRAFGFPNPPIVLKYNIRNTGRIYLER